MYYNRITEFIFREDKPEAADFIFIPGSGYGELAEKAAMLYREGFSKKIVVSGKHSILNDTFEGPVSPKKYKHRTYQTESDFLKEVLLENGVNEKDILQEKEAAFTFENAVYIRILLEKMGYQKETMPQKVLLVCQAFHAARSAMYFEYMFPDTQMILCPANTQGITKENWYKNEKGIRTVLGEVKRIGNQFTDLMEGKDRAEEECRKKAAASENKV